MTEGLLVLLIFFGLIFSVISHSVVIIALVNSDWDICYTPKTFYEKTNMNWFGCTIVYIILFPFGFVLAIGGFLRWLFTIGRKD